MLWSDSTWLPLVPESNPYHHFKSHKSTLLGPDGGISGGGDYRAVRSGPRGCEGGRTPLEITEILGKKKSCVGFCVSVGRILFIIFSALIFFFNNPSRGDLFERGRRAWDYPVHTHTLGFTYIHLYKPPLGK